MRALLKFLFVVVVLCGVVFAGAWFWAGRGEGPAISLRQPGRFVGQASTALYGFTQNQFIYLQNLINLAGPLVALALLSTSTGAVASSVSNKLIISKAPTLLWATATHSGKPNTTLEMPSRICTVNKPPISAA